MRKLRRRMFETSAKIYGNCAVCNIAFNKRRICNNHKFPFEASEEWKFFSERPSPATHSRLPLRRYINTTDTRKICIELGRRGAGRKQRNNKIEKQHKRASRTLTAVCIQNTSFFSSLSW